MRQPAKLFVFYRAMLAQSAVIRLHVVRPSVCLSVCNDQVPCSNRFEFRNAPLAEINKNSGAHHKNFNEDRLMLSAAKCRPGA